MHDPAHRAQRLLRDTIRSVDVVLLDHNGNPIGPDHPLRKPAVAELHAKLTELKRCLDDGLITREQFEAKRRELLDRY